MVRTLKFIVDKQIINPNPDCDFSGIIPVTEGYLRAEFSFSSECDGCTKVAAFFSYFGKESPPQILEAGKSCVFPSEALARRNFYVQIIG